MVGESKQTLTARQRTECGVCQRRPWGHLLDQAGIARSKEEEESALAALEERLRGAEEAQGGETHKALIRAKAKARHPVRSTHA